jgi:hypothetical protein
MGARARRTSRIGRIAHGWLPDGIPSPTPRST